MGINVENPNLHKENQGLYYENPELTEGEITVLSTLMYISKYEWTNKNSSVADLIHYMLNDNGLKKEEKNHQRNNCMNILRNIQMVNLKRLIWRNFLRECRELNGSAFCSV